MRKGEEVRRVLQTVFGLSELRPGQQEVIDRMLAGLSTLAVMPTGAGKSLCYQLPALVLPGCTVVVSPLIALMKDQCEKLRERGVSAVQLNSHCNAEETRNAEDAIASGEARILLTTPERFADPALVELLQTRPLAMVVVDEAHCISQWGHDFRPAFLDIESSLRHLGGPPVLALTATASDAVAREIMERLRIPAGGHIDTGVFRANLRYAVEQVEDADAKNGRVLSLVRESAGSGIVYAATVSAATEVHRLLEAAGESVGLYHGRLGAADRRQVQDAFMHGDVRVMVATNAFGMGIDKPDIRLVLHYQMPGGLDAYYQESGRAGRDGEAAQCVLLFMGRDKSVQQFFMAGRYPDAKDLHAVHRALTTPRQDDAAAGWTASDLSRQISMPLKKVQGVLHVLRHHRAVRKAQDATFALTSRSLTPSQLTSLLEEYVAMRERDQAVLDGMVLYAQTGRCRWQVLLDHLEGHGERPRCNHCDNCQRIAAQEARMAQAIVVASGPGEVAPSEAVKTAHSAPFSRGERVKVKRYGLGTVLGADDASVTIEFSDGASRCFHPAFVRAAPAARRSAGEVRDSDRTGTAAG